MDFLQDVWVFSYCFPDTFGPTMMSSMKQNDPRTSTNAAIGFPIKASITWARMRANHCPPALWSVLVLWVHSCCGYM